MAACTTSPGSGPSLAGAEPRPAEYEALDVRLREVTRENLRDVLRLAVREDQEQLVASNAVSISQAHFEERAWFRAIYAGDAAVGFVMMSRLDDDRDYLWRLMIDASQQRKGYGQHAMELVIDETRAQPGKRAIVLSHARHDGHAGPFYERLGFRYTGDEDEGELVMRLEL